MQRDRPVDETSIFAKHAGLPVCGTEGDQRVPSRPGTMGCSTMWYSVMRTLCHFEQPTPSTPRTSAGCLWPRWCNLQCQAVRGDRNPILMMGKSGAATPIQKTRPFPWKRNQGLDEDLEDAEEASEPNLGAH